MPRVDGISNGYLVHRYLAKCEFIKMDDNDPENKKVAYHKKYYKIQWKNIEYDLKGLINPFRLAEKLGVKPEFAYQMGVIALDSADAGNYAGTPGTTSLTVSHTCAAGSVLVADVFGTYVGTPANNPTYNSVSMGNYIFRDDDQNCNLYGLLNPSSGANNLTITYGSNSITAISGISITGADTTAFGGATGKFSGNASGVFSATVTTTRNNSIIVSWAIGGGNTDNLTGSTDATRDAFSYIEGYKFASEHTTVQATSGTGFNVFWTNTSSGTRYNGLAALEIRSPAASGPSGVKTFEGVATASIKTADGIAIASIKSILGIS